MDQQYMQQSSQIYVFSTEWANKGAQAVMEEQFGSIIEWHGSQPQTKKHLEVENQNISWIDQHFKCNSSFSTWLVSSRISKTLA